MPEERANQVRLCRQVGQLKLDAIFQTFPSAQRTTGVAGALGVTPHQLVGVQFGGVARQEVQRQLALQLGDVCLDGPGLVRRQVVEDQVQGLSLTAHQAAQEDHKQVAIQTALVRGEPERAFGTNCGCGNDALALTGHIDYGRLALSTPSLAVHRIGPESGFIPEVDVRLVALGLAGDRGIGLALPTGDGFGVALVGPLQRLLGRQSSPRQQRPYRRQAQRHAKTLRDQLPHGLARPQPEVESILPRVLAVHPPEHLLLLRRGQRSPPPRRLLQPQRALALAAPARLAPHLVRPAPVHPERRRDSRQRFAFGHPVQCHEAHRFLRLTRQRAAIDLHVNFDRSHGNLFPNLLTYE